MTDANEPTRRCTNCGEVKPIRGGFYQSKSRAHKPLCRACLRRRQIERVQHVTDYINAYKMERGCADCGWREFPQALEFDHRPGVAKVAHISILRTTAPIAVVAAEMAKCDVVCAICHRRRTVARGDASNGANYDLRKDRTGRFRLGDTDVRLAVSDLIATGEPDLLSLLEP